MFPVSVSLKCFQIRITFKPFHLVELRHKNIPYTAKLETEK